VTALVLFGCWATYVVRSTRPANTGILGCRIWNHRCGHAFLREPVFNEWLSGHGSEDTSLADSKWLRANDKHAAAHAVLEESSHVDDHSGKSHQVMWARCSWKSLSVSCTNFLIHVILFWHGNDGIQTRGKPTKAYVFKPKGKKSRGNKKKSAKLTTVKISPKAINGFATTNAQLQVTCACSWKKKKKRKKETLLTLLSLFYTGIPQSGRHAARGKSRAAIFDCHRYLFGAILGAYRQPTAAHTVSCAWFFLFFFFFFCCFTLPSWGFVMHLFFH
jgi:hypothetical protein